MGFLKRLFGGQASQSPDDGAEAPGAIDLVAEEQARERELMRAEAERLDDDLIQRQLRYADMSWSPPAEGGERRADDGESPAAD